jgi:hypothetical protein
MGVDAYRLAPRLGQLKALPDSRVEGLSGSLGMTPTSASTASCHGPSSSAARFKRLPDTPR